MVGLSCGLLSAYFENGLGGETPPKLAGQRPAIRSAGVLACEFARRLAARNGPESHFQNTLSMPLLMFLDVFLFESQLLRRVQHEHLHSDVGGHVLRGELREDEHQAHRQRQRPNRRLLAQDAQERMLRPEGSKIQFP